ncbi:DUF3624 domain-containing protein [Psychromonas sp. CD1]|uniref:DUF3624 domain-containing protein n=1 Tax=Psychromonas sp. CD1 TaxID=1979839 RepID=UPI0015DBA3A1|nr:DUF3624 domain-containing protein [Psychromonas sp. CD1]
MSCKSCLENKFKEKLGRCRLCMISNLILLFSGALLWWFCFRQDAKQVASIALLFALLGCALLMFAHILAFIYYRITEDKHRLK